MSTPEHPSHDRGGPRLAALDALRGLAVFAMIHQHVSIWLWRGPDPGRTNFDYPGLVLLNTMVVIGAPMFFVLSGLGTAMLARRADRPGLDATLLRRGAMLVGYGLLVNLLTPSWFSWGSFFALHLMGVSIACAPLWRRLSDRALLGLAFAVLAITPWVQAALALPGELSNPEMRDTSLPGGVLRLWLAGSQYSLLPWLSTYLLGYWAGRMILQDRLAALVRVGLVLAAATVLGHLALRLTAAAEGSVLWYGYRFKVGWFPAPVVIVMGLLAPTLWIIAAVVRRDRRRPLRADHPLVAMGRMSLTVFIVHAPLFRELSRPLGLWSALAPAPTLAFVVGFTLLCLWVARAWARVDFRYGAEWWLRRLADRRPDAATATTAR
ncbi:MAG: DUF418 domain-containing transporter [Deltaproteobacteria bacterium]|nr:DUF418 domain-containing transporter [Deltaproteobacteria bacterium]MBP7291062.1 DUF418 domain-containing transporter [Nannocystaceae bacterium]